MAEKELALVPPQDVGIMTRTPEAVLTEARNAAKALKDVLDRKSKPVKFGGEQYLEFEDWQTVGKFYNVTTRLESSRFIEYGNARGFEAHAVAVNLATDQIVASADSMCLNDEPNWRGKPLFQVRSMAQTRACAKALRNYLSWVVVLAGYKPTPAEEMEEIRPSKTPPNAIKAVLDKAVKETEQEIEAETLAGMTNQELDQLILERDKQACPGEDVQNLPWGDFLNHCLEHHKLAMQALLKHMHVRTPSQMTEQQKNEFRFSMLDRMRREPT